MSGRRTPLVPLCSWLWLLCLAPLLIPQEITPQLYSQLHDRFSCPGGNRASAVAGVPGNPQVGEEKRYRKRWINAGWYPVESWGTGGGLRGIKVAPGRDTVALKSAG